MTVAVTCALTLAACGGGGEGGTVTSGGTTSAGSTDSATLSGWSTPAATDSGTAGNADFFPAAAIDAQGNILAVWMKATSLGYEVWSSRYIPGQGWSTSVRLDTTDDWTYGTLPVLQLAGNANGQALAVWEQNFIGIGTTSLWSRSYDPSTGWGTPVQIAASPVNYSASTGIDASGNAMVAWLQSDLTAQIVVARYVAGTGSWAPQVTVTTGAKTSIPYLAVSSSGTAILAWQQTISSPSVIAATLAASYNPASGWGQHTQVVVASTLQNSMFTIQDGLAVGIDGSGNATLVYGEESNASGSQTTTIKSQRYAPSSGWQSAQTITTSIVGPSGTRSLNFPFLSVSPQGVAAAVWTAMPESPPPLQASVASASGSWGPAQQLPADIGYNQPQLAIDGNGNVTVAWADVRTRTILVTRYVNGAWSATPVSFGITGTGNGSPALAANASGTAVLLWPTGTQIQASIYTPGS